MKLDFRFKAKPSLTEKEIQSGLSAVLYDGLAAQAVGALTGGVFLVAFALELGASNLAIGLVAAVLPLAQLLQIPSVYLIKKCRSRRAITVYAILFGRLCCLFIAAIPFFFPPDKGLRLLIIALALNAAFGSVSYCGWTSWMRDLIPQSRLGSFFSRRMSLAMGFGIFLGLAAGFFLSSWKKYFPGQEIYSYSFLFLLGFLAGAVGLYFLSITPEPEIAQPEEEVPFGRMILKPFRDANFKHHLLFIGLWNFAINLALPFFSVYMLKGLQLDMSLVIILTILGQIMNVASLRIWGRLSDLFGNKSVLSINIVVFIACILSWTFTTMPNRHILTVPLLVVIHIFMGIAMGGFYLTADNLGYKLAPHEEATSYLAAKNLVQYLAAGTAPVLGGKFVDFFTQCQCSWSLSWFGPKGQFTFRTLSIEHWDFFFLFACLIGLCALYRLSAIREQGEVKGKVVIDELRLEVKRAMVSLYRAPSLAVRAVLERIGQPEIQAEPLTLRIEELSLKELSTEELSTEDLSTEEVSIEGLPTEELSMEEVSRRPALLSLSDSVTCDSAEKSGESEQNFNPSPPPRSSS